MKTRFDAAQVVTDWALDNMERHGTDWSRPWSGVEGMPTSMSSGKEYRGINTLLLWAQPFGDHRWGTYKAWQGKEAQVRKGEKGTFVVFWKLLESRTEPGKKFPMLRSYKVFNAEQVDGAPALPVVEVRPLAERLEGVESFVAKTGAKVEHSGQPQAYYQRPPMDMIHLPNLENFENIESYYSTLLHELTHWTGAEHRLDRTKGKRFGDQAYAFEELVAELGSAMLCHRLGISNEPRADHAKYLNIWIKRCREDNRAIINAASLAAKALDYLSGFSAEEGLDENKES